MISVIRTYVRIKGTFARGESRGTAFILSSKVYILSESGKKSKSFNSGQGGVSFFQGSPEAISGLEIIAFYVDAVVNPHRVGVDSFALEISDTGGKD